MYKKFFMGIAAMAALTLVSCSSDDLNSLQTILLRMRLSALMAIWEEVQLL
mgnify:CR=1 FL=1